MSAKRRQPRKGATPAGQWDDLLDEGGRTEVVEDMPSSIWHKFAKAYLWLAVISLPLMAFVAASLMVTLRDTTSTLQELSGAQRVSASSPGRSAATQSLEDWLAHVPSPLPGGKVLTWDGSHQMPREKRVDKNNQDVTEQSTWASEVNDFTLVDGAGRQWMASVQVKIDPRGGAVAVGTPSLVPQIPTISDEWQSGSPWPGVSDDPALLTDPVEAAVKNWAEAYISGDPGKLILSTGDSDPSHTYVPMVGPTKVEATPVAAAGVTYTDTASIWVQVELLLTWPGQDADKTVGRNPSPVTMDLLVRRANTASPVVTAWGAPGTAPGLLDYSNAVSARAVETEAPPQLTPTPTTKES